MKSIAKYDLPKIQKRIGFSYLLLAFCAAFIAALLPLIFHYQNETFLFMPLNDDSKLFFFQHGFIMVCFMTVPALYCGFGNLIVPYALKLEKTIFPKWHQAAFILLCIAILVFFIGAFKSPQESDFFPWILVSFSLFAFSLLINAILFILTILIFPGKETTIKEWSFFTWSVFISSFFFILYLPMFLGSLVHYFYENQLFEKQLFFWVFSYPESYIFLLLSFGILGEIVGRFLPLSAYIRNTILALFNVYAIVGFVLWSHNLFLNDSHVNFDFYFYKIFPLFFFIFFYISMQFLRSFFQKKTKIQMPLLWVFAALLVFLIGSIAIFCIYFEFIAQGVLQKILFSQFHYVLSLNIVFSLFAALYYWAPVIFNMQFSEKITKIHFLSFFIGVNLLFLPSLFLHEPTKNLLYSSIFFIIFSLIAFFCNIFMALKRKNKIQKKCKKIKMVS